MSKIIFCWQVPCSSRLTDQVTSILQQRLTMAIVADFIMIPSTSNLNKPFAKRWRQLYSENLLKEHPNMQEHHIVPYQHQEEHDYGQFEEFRARKLGAYHIVKNYTYGFKKGSPMIDKARLQHCITLPVTADESNFKGFPTQHIIAFVDLEKRSLIWPNEEKRRTPDFITLKTFQFCTGHCLLIFDSDLKLPQILTAPLIHKLLIVSGLLTNYTFGFNSQGGGSTLNYLHFQVIQSKVVTDGQAFHFQSIKGKELKSFAVESEQERDAEITVSSFDFIGAVFVRVSCKDFPLSHPSIIDKATQIIFRVVHMALELVIPHNLNFPNPHNFYIILRDFSTPEIRYGWIQFSGIFKSATEQDFNGVDIKRVGEQYQKLALKRQVKEKIYSSLKAIFN